jgi:hypothetical protein
MKINNLKRCVAILSLTIVVISCTKVINLKLGNDSGKLVIEGNVTNVYGPQYIVLTHNVPFTNTNTYPPVTGATVTVSDNMGNTYPFTEGAAGVYASGTFGGIAGNKYTMAVTTGGVTYTAGSIMPALVQLDSISAQPDAFNSSNNRRQINVHFQDPGGIVNQYRFVMFVNNVQVNSTFAYNDEFTNGRYVNLEIVETTTDIYPGDSVKVEMQCIDKPVYNYWYTLMQQQQDGPGGGVAPSNPPTNITPVSLGYFSAHTTQTQSIVVK